MARRAEGWKLFFKRGWGYVRFTHEKTNFRLATGERDPERATARAKALYAEVVSGRWRPVERGITPLEPLDVLFARYLVAIESELDVDTVDTYKGYARNHALPFFGSLERFTTAACADYRRARLGQVLRKTVRKELSFLRGFSAWLVEQKYLAEEGAPNIPRMPRKGSPGVRAGKQRAKPVHLTPGEVEALLAALPEMGGKARNRFVVRARFVVAYETALRPATLDELSVPEHYRRGSPTLTIDDDDDKIRFGRELPLSKRARAALDACVPDIGRIFGRHDYRPSWGKAVAASKVPELVAPYDLRHARVTHLLEQTGNLPGVGYLAGHTQATTTNKYSHPGQRAANAVLGAMRDHSGPDAEEDSVRRKGLEPLQELPHWNLNAAGIADPSGIADASRVQEGQEDPPDPPISAPGARILEALQGGLRDQRTIGDELDRAYLALLEEDEFDAASGDR